MGEIWIRGHDEVGEMEAASVTGWGGTFRV